MEFIYEYGLFLAQAVTFVAAVLILVAGLVSLGHRQRVDQHEGHIEIRDLNEKYRHIGEAIHDVIDDHKIVKEQKKAAKEGGKGKGQKRQKEAQEGRGHASRGSSQAPVCA